MVTNHSNLDAQAHSCSGCDADCIALMVSRVSTCAFKRKSKKTHAARDLCRPKRIVRIVWPYRLHKFASFGQEVRAGAVVEEQPSVHHTTLAINDNVTYISL